MYQAKYALSNVAPATTDSSIITAKPGFAFRIIGGFVVCGATATKITFNSKPTGAGTAITSEVSCGSYGGLIFPAPSQDRAGELPCGYFQTNRGEGLTATTGAGGTVGVTLTYLEI